MGKTGAKTERNRRPKILAADRSKPLAYFGERAEEAGADLIYGGAKTPGEIVPLVEDADVVMVYRTFVNAEAIARMKRCRLILRQGIGFDLIDVSAATRAGIFVSNIPDYCIDEVANHALMLMLAAVRNLFDYHKVMTTTGFGAFNESRKVPPMADMKLGIVGLGKIGRAFVRRAAPMGFDILGYDPYVHQDVFETMGVTRVRELDELLIQADILSIHCPYTPETDRLIGERELGLMKPGSYLINTARGKIVDLDALDRALAEGQLAAAGLDVFQEEPLDASHPILSRPNLVATPHVAFYSEASLRRVTRETMDEVIRVLEGGRPRNLVNPDVYTHLRAPG